MSAERDIPGLREVGAAYSRAVRVEQPPREVDRAICSAAAVHAARGNVRRARARTFAIGAAIAATLVIALATALRTDREAASRLDSAAAPSATVNEARPAPPLADESGARASAKISIDPGPIEGASGGECVAVSAAPDPWLACIATLARAGRTAAAAHELDAFRARFPEHEPLPDFEALAPR